MNDLKKSEEYNTKSSFLPISKKDLRCLLALYKIDYIKSIGFIAEEREMFKISPLYKNMALLIRTKMKSTDDMIVTKSSVVDIYLFLIQNLNLFKKYKSIIENIENRAKKNKLTFLDLEIIVQLSKLILEIPNYGKFFKEIKCSPRYYDLLKTEKVKETYVLSESSRGRVQNQQVQEYIFSNQKFIVVKNYLLAILNKVIDILSMPEGNFWNNIIPVNDVFGKSKINVFFQRALSMDELNETYLN